MAAAHVVVGRAVVVVGAAVVVVVGAAVVVVGRAVVVVARVVVVEAVVAGAAVVVTFAVVATAAAVVGAAVVPGEVVGVSIDGELSLDGGVSIDARSLIEPSDWINDDSVLADWLAERADSASACRSSVCCEASPIAPTIATNAAPLTIVVLRRAIAAACCRVGFRPSDGGVPGGAKPDQRRVGMPSISCVTAPRSSAEGSALPPAARLFPLLCRSLSQRLPIIRLLSLWATRVALPLIW